MAPIRPAKHRVVQQPSGSARPSFMLRTLAFLLPAFHFLLQQGIRAGGWARDERFLVLFVLNKMCSTPPQYTYVESRNQASLERTGRGTSRHFLRTFGTSNSPARFIGPFGWPRVARVRAEYPNQLDYSGFCWTQEGATVPHHACVLSQQGHVRKAAWRVWTETLLIDG